MKLWASLTAWRRPSEGLNYFTSYSWFCFFTSVVSERALPSNSPLRHAAPPLFMSSSRPSDPDPALAARHFCSVFIWFTSYRRPAPSRIAAPSPTAPSPRRQNLAPQTAYSFSRTRPSVNRRPVFYEPSEHYIPRLFTAAVIFCPAALTAATRTLFTDGAARGRCGGREAHVAGLDGDICWLRDKTGKQAWEKKSRKNSTMKNVSDPRGRPEPDQGCLSWRDT